jgi:hypothetical protein
MDAMGRPMRLTLMREMILFFPVFVILQLLFSGVSAQGQISGNIKGNEEILFSATIRNISQHQTNISDLGGNYKIVAIAGDSIIFSHQGYISDTVVVSPEMFSGRLPVELKIKMSYLASVDVNEMTKYELDSLGRREDYDYIFKNKNNKPLWDNQLSGDGRGVNFSPIGHYSASEKQKRKLKERLERDDKEEFIYYKFTRRVPRLTGLRGDSLLTFINKYKPSYEYCLSATSVDIFLYINDKLVIYKKEKN